MAPVGPHERRAGGHLPFQYLGENKAGAVLFGGAGSNYEGPVLNITGTMTEGLGEIDGNAQLIGDTDPTPFRVHSDQRMDGTVVSKSSGGCFMFSLAQLKKLSEAFNRWGVKPGDTFNGYLAQDFPQ
jgi:hypothetical protein